MYLKQCPVCKHPISSKNLDEWQGRHSILCRCGKRSEWADSPEEAIQRWNALEDHQKELDRRNYMYD